MIGLWHEYCNTSTRSALHINKLWPIGNQFNRSVLTKQAIQRTNAARLLRRLYRSIGLTASARKSIQVYRFVRIGEIKGVASQTSDPTTAHNKNIVFTIVLNQNVTSSVC